MIRTDCNKKMEEHLDGRKILKQVINRIKESYIDDIIKKKINPNNSITPRNYGALKIHKFGIPLRPIVDTIGSPTYALAKHLEKKLRPSSGNTSSYIKDFASFPEWIRNLKMNEEVLMVSLDIAYLHTMIPMDEAIDMMRKNTNEETPYIIRLCLKSSYFSFNGKICEPTHKVAIGSPLSPIISNLYMEHFQQKSLNSFPYTPDEWKRLVDDVSAKWRHGKDKLKTFLAYINNMFDHIKFTIEIKKDNQLHFLDILLTKKEGGLSFQVFRKRTHTQSYMHANSHQHPKQKTSIMNAQTTRAIRTSDADHLNQEMNHLGQLF